MVLEGFMTEINPLENFSHFLSLEATTFNAFNRFFFGVFVHVSK